MQHVTKQVNRNSANWTNLFQSWHPRIRRSTRPRYHATASSIFRKIKLVDPTPRKPPGKGYALETQRLVPEDIIEDDLFATLRAHRARNASRQAAENDAKSEQSVTHAEVDTSMETLPQQEEGEKQRQESKVEKSLESENESLQEYEGRVQPLHNQWIHKSETDIPLRMPWLSYIDSFGETALDKLSAEILAFERYMTCSPTETAAFREVITATKNVLRKQLKIRLVGSRWSGLADPVSDLDFVLSNPRSKEWLGPSAASSLAHNYKRLPSAGGASANGASDGRGEKDAEHGRQSLKAVQEAYAILQQRSDVFDEVRCIENSTLVHARHMASGLGVNLKGPSKTNYLFQHEIVKGYLEEYSQLKPLYITLRSCLQHRNLMSARGGLGSYPLLIMILTAFKHAGDGLADNGVGDRLLHVLKFWAEADTDQWGYAAEPTFRFQKEDPHDLQFPPTVVSTSEIEPSQLGVEHIKVLDPHRPYLLCLQDPADYFNDLGKKVHLFKHIKATFQHLYDSLCSRLNDPAEFSTATCFLAPILEASYVHFEQQRNRILRFEEQDQPRWTKRAIMLRLSPILSMTNLLRAQEVRSQAFAALSSERGKEDDFGQSKEARKERLMERYQGSLRRNPRILENRLGIESSKAEALRQHTK
ncbi:uncharacterized protein KY384_006225 [Bacidia gigantensis]|uniref:uncharacterized protein n=1 Tax=Bacidia gigantensis TaxID=2732470 RepID=UPI001D038BFF|nr:uncharacterized protein KY384_006225 [Bacidia gigantensis]KAG8529588.1 hypothetical protein KY384_006225 [Bacidia gigantensis]